MGEWNHNQNRNCNRITLARLDLAWLGCLRMDAVAAAASQSEQARLTQIRKSAICYGDMCAYYNNIYKYHAGVSTLSMQIQVYG